MYFVCVERMLLQLHICALCVTGHIDVVLQVVVNQDKMSQQLTSLRSKIQQLEVELQEFKSGRKVVSEDGSVAVNDMANEITMLRTENDKYDKRHVYGGFSQCAHALYVII